MKKSMVNAMGFCSENEILIKAVNPSRGKIFLKKLPHQAGQIIQESTGEASQ